MESQIIALIFNPLESGVWDSLTGLGLIDEYSSSARAMVIGWARNASLYSEDGCPGELDTEILQQVEHLRQSKKPRAPLVNPYVDANDALTYGVQLRAYKPGTEVRVVGVAGNNAPTLKLEFLTAPDPELLRLIALTLEITLPNPSTELCALTATQMISPIVGKIEVQEL